MQYSKKLLDDLQKTRAERKALQKIEHNLRTEINKQSGLETKDLYPEKQQNKLTTSETLTIGRMLSQHRTTKDWCEYIEQLINGRLKK